MSLLPVAGTTDVAKPENRAFYPALDGLRATALLMVVLWHYCHIAWCWAGVNMFFVLSGFLITGILYDTRDDKFRIRNFYVRRTLRIFPLYYGIFAIFLLAAPFTHWLWSRDWLVWPAYLANLALYVHPIIPGSPLQGTVDGTLVATRYLDLPLHVGHFWTLCIEEQFYLIWPCVVFALRDRKKLLWLCAASVPVILLLRIAGAHLLPKWMLLENVLIHVTFFRVDDLLLGGWLALVLRGPSAAALMRWSKAIAPYAAAVLILWFLLTRPHHLHSVFYIYPATYQTFGLTFIALISATILVLAIQPGTCVYRALNLYPLRWLGRLSYGAYVWHDIFHEYYVRTFDDGIVRFAAHAGRYGSTILRQEDLLIGLLTLVPTFALAWLSFRFYETPFLNLKERWTVR